MSKPWSTVGAAGAWALDAERAEAEEAERTAAAHSTAFTGEPVQCFPTPKEAETSKAAASKKKKKKGVPIPLSVFTTNTYVGPGDALRNIAHEQMLCLPTGPRDRAPEELEKPRGFRSTPFKEADNWVSVKKPGMDYGRNVGTSKADEVDNWSSGKIFVAHSPRRSSGSAAGYGFRTGSGVDSDRWGRGGVCSVSSNAVRERPKLVLLPRNQDVEARAEIRRCRPNPFLAARPREEVLAEKGLDWKKMEMELEMKKKNIANSTAQSRGTGSSMASRAKINPFGEAKPREVVLEEKGMDWRKIDFELERRRIERLSFVDLTNRV